MRWFSFAVILLITVLLEAGNFLTVSAFGDWAVHPSILITLLVFYSFSSQPRDAVICSYIIGFAADLTGDVIGPHMICFGLLGLLLNHSNQILFARRAIYKAMLVLIVYVISETFSHWLGLLKGIPMKDGFYSLVLFIGIYSAVISPLIWSLLSGISRGFSSEKSKYDRVYH